jgi:hypothetical protein
MQGMQGMAPMMPPPEEDAEPEIREKVVQQALEFVSKPEVMPAEDEEEEERDKKMEQIKQYLDQNMGLNEDEMNAVLKRSGLDPTAGDSTTDSDQSSEEESDDEVTYEQQQNLDMRGAVPLPITLSIVALLLSVPDHAAWWRWIMGDPLPTVGQPLHHQLRQRGSGAASAISQPYGTPPLVVINQPQPAIRSSGWGTRRWLLTLFGVWFVVTWVRTNWHTTLLPYVRAATATVAAMMGLVRLDHCCCISRVNDELLHILSYSCAHCDNLTLVFMLFFAGSEGGVTPGL